jgi:hypothetical protein
VRFIALEKFKLREQLILRINVAVKFARN